VVVPPEGCCRWTAAEFADSYIAYLAATVDNPATVSTAVAETLSRPAESFASWLTEHRSRFTPIGRIDDH
jgi:hypothetical protein